MVNWWHKLTEMCCEIPTVNAAIIAFPAKMTFMLTFLRYTNVIKDVSCNTTFKLYTLGIKNATAFYVTTEHLHLFL